MASSAIVPRELRGAERIGARGWSAIDTAAETRVNEAATRSQRWQDRLYAWLIEFNKY